MSARTAVEGPDAPQRSEQFLGVVLSEDGVAEWEDGRKVVFIPRDELQDLRYEFGWRSERPIAQGLFGTAVLAAGLYMCAAFISAFLRNGMVFLPKTFTGLGIVLPMLGGWALLGALRRGHLLRAVLRDGDTRKLLFHGKFDAPELDAFIARAREIGYSIRVP